MLDKTNFYRQRKNKAPLRWSGTLANIAAPHSRWMAEAGSCSHDNVDDRFGQIECNAKAENVAYTSHGTAESMVKDWYNSPGHKKNMLGDFACCGIAIAEDNSGGKYATQLFSS